MKLEIRHRTIYRYSSPLRRAVQTLRLSPVSNAHQQVVHWRVEANGSLHAQQDAWGNPSHLLTCEQTTSRVVCESSGLVHTHGCAELVDPNGPPPALFRRDSKLAAGSDQRIALLAQAVLVPAGAALPGRQHLLALADQVTRVVPYGGGCTDAGTTAVQALDAAQGVCQDQAHVFIAACRRAGLAARYVSGYFHAPHATELSSHAWAEVCVDEPSRRWLSVDVTHGCTIDERHVRLAVGPDYAACSPVVGVRSGGGTETMQVQIQVRAL